MPLYVYPPVSTDRVHLEYVWLDSLYPTIPYLSNITSLGAANMQIPTSLLVLASLSHLVAAQILGLEKGMPDGWKGLELTSCTRQSVDNFAWTRIWAACNGKASDLSGFVPGADHVVSGAEAQAWVAERVEAFLRKL